MKTYSAKPETVKRDWYVIDATDKVLGRLSTEIARRLRRRGVKGDKGIRSKSSPHENRNR